MAKDRLGKKVAYGMLAAFYAPLLTLRQQELLSLYCDEDLSLSEIASQMDISRQAVSDNLNRAYEKLDDLEGHLSMFNSYQELKNRMARCQALLAKVRADEHSDIYLQKAILLLQDDGPVDDEGGETHGI